MLNFQKLDVYRCAIEFLAFALELVARLGRGNRFVAEQFRSAALSIPLNIAESAGRTSEADSARHHAYARGSAMECAAILDALQLLKVTSVDEYRRGMDLLVRVISMLTKLCR